MKNSFIQKTGAFSTFAGSLLLVLYSVMVAIILTQAKGGSDIILSIRHPFWMPSTIVVFAGLLLLMTGFAVVYSLIAKNAGLFGFVSLLAIEAAYLFQAAKVTWEICIFPLLANNEGAAFLISEGVLFNNISVMIYFYLSTALLLIGIVMFSITLYRSNCYSKLSSLLILVGVIMYGGGEFIHITVSIAGIIIFAAGCTLVGLRLLKGDI